MTKPVEQPSVKARVLVLTTAFPTPGKFYRMWSFGQVRALEEAGYETRLVNVVPWLPRVFGAMNTRLRSWATVPPSHDWDGLTVRYLRAPWYYHGDRCWMPRHWCKLSWAAIAKPLRKEVQAFRPDMIYTMGILPSGYFAQRISRESGAPHVLSGHSVNELSAWQASPWSRRLVEEILGGAAATVVVNNAMKRAAAEIAPQAELRVVHNGFDFPAVEDTVSQPGAGPVVVCCSSFQPRKNIPLLIRVFGSVAKNHPDARLRIIGTGPTMPEAQATLRSLNLGERIKLLGRLSHESVMEEMAAADVFALISAREPLATVLIEAMAHGKPIFCCSDGGIADVAEDGVHGRLVPPNDEAAAAEALNSMLLDLGRCREMGAQAQGLYSDYFTASHWMGRLENVFQQALASAPVG